MTSLSYAVEEGVATITLRRPAARNALNVALKAELAEALAEARHNGAVRALIITGEGGAFCAGGDIKEMDLNDCPVTTRNRLKKLLEDIFIPLHEIEKPTIAAVNGHAHGSGLSLALACDLIIASDDAEFSCAFGRIGLVPDCGSLYFLPRRVPVGIAKDLIFTGRRVEAAEALAMGLVNRILPKSELMDSAGQLARELATGPTVAFGMAKTILARSGQIGLREVAEMEALAQAVACSTEDHVAARTAFLNKSTPTFSGR